MKKYSTILLATLAGTAIAVAAPVDLKQSLEVNSTQLQKSENVLIKNNPDMRFASPRVLVKHDNVSKKNLLSTPLSSRAEGDGETTEPTQEWHLSYAYPLGTFFPQISYRQTINDAATGKTLGISRFTQQLGIVIPPLVENEWTNLVQKTTFTDESYNIEWLPETEKCDWIYSNGDYTEEAYLAKNFKASAYDLSFESLPSFADYPRTSPYMFYGDDFFVLNDGKYITNIVNKTTLSQAELEAKNDEFDTKLTSNNQPVKVIVDDFKNAGSYLFDEENSTSLTVSTYAMAGNDAKSIGLPQAPTTYCKSIWASTLGTSDFEMTGLFQVIPPSTTDYILKGISVNALYRGPKESPIEYAIFDVTEDGSIGSQLREGILESEEELTEVETSSDVTYYGGQITLSAKFEDVFSGEADYLTVPAGTQLIIIITGGDQCGIFGPFMSQFDFTNGPDAYTLDTNAGVVVTVGDQLFTLPVKFYFDGETPNTYIKYTNFTVAVDVEYPYLAAFMEKVPTSFEASLGNGTITIYDLERKPFGTYKNELDIQFTPKKVTEIVNGNQLTGNVFEFVDAEYGLVTNAQPEDIEFTYSDDNVKNAIKCSTEMGAQIHATTTSGQTMTLDAAYVVVKFEANEGATVPTSGWIKASYNGKEVTFNLTATSGIENISDSIIESEAVATELYDLQGRKLSGDAQGIVIKKMTMADGSVKTVKVVK